jgi:hypothetical protein
MHFGQRTGNGSQYTSCVALAMKGRRTTSTKSSYFKGKPSSTTISEKNGRRLGGGKGGYGYNRNSNGYSSYHNQAYSSYYGYYGNGRGGTYGTTTNPKNNNYTGSYSHSNQSRTLEWYAIVLIVIIALIGMFLLYLSIPEIMACSSANKNRRKTNEAVSDYQKFDENIPKGEVDTTKAVAHSKSVRITVHSGRPRPK